MTTSDGTVKGVTKIVDHGPDSQRWNLVLLSEGFRSTELSDYHTHAQNLVNALRRDPAFGAVWNAINIHRVDVESNESGADDPAQSTVGGQVLCAGGAGTTARTYFDATFCGDKLSRRSLKVDVNIAIDVANDKVPGWHEILVVVNSTIHGGSGGAVGTYSLAGNPEETALHELGHMAFGLADEYEYRVGCGSGETTQNSYTGGEPGQHNVTINIDRRTNKWRNLIDANTAMPTTSNLDCSICDIQLSPVPAGTVGTFEGALEFHCGCYRPEFNCRMRQLGQPFCAVCHDRILRDLSPYLPWFSLGQRLLLAGSGSLAAVKWAGENIQVFAFDRQQAGARGELIYNQLYHMWTEPHPYDWNRNPTGWRPLGERLPFAGSLAVVKWAGENIQVFAFANTAGPPLAPPASQQLYHMWTEPHPYDWNRNPTGWRPLGQRLSIKSGPVAVKWAGENIQVFALGTDNQLYHMWTEPHPYDWGNNGQWAALGQQLSFAGDLAAVEWAGDNIQVFAFDVQRVGPRREFIFNQLYHMWTEPHPYRWNRGGWIPMGWKLPFAGRPVAVKWAGENSQVFAFTNTSGPPNVPPASQQLYHMWTDPDPFHWM
jgi:hypothetical protein